MMTRAILQALFLPILTALSVSAVGLSGHAQEPPRSPAEPKPVERWRPPQPPAGAPRVVVPDAPPAQEVEPLSGRPVLEVPAPQDPNARLRQIPEEPPIEEEGAVVWEDLLRLTLRPALLPIQNRLSVIRDGVILREGPGLDFPSLGTLLRGDSLRRLDTDDGWSRVVIASGTEGWVYAELTQPIEETPAIIAGDRVNLRSEPSTDGLILGSLYQGALVVASERNGEWIRIRTPNLEEAYVAGPYIRLLPPQFPPNPPLRAFVSQSDRPVASLAVVDETTAETAYLLAVWGDEWVKGGKVGLLYLLSGERNPLESIGATNAVFTEGPYFEATVRQNDFDPSFGAKVELPPDTVAVTAAYLRGKKKDRIWLFEFALDSSQSGGRFALVCQEGPQTGAYLLLPERRSE